MSLIEIEELEPESRDYGVGAGTPIARRYIDLHMSLISPAIAGPILEFGGPRYAAGLGKPFEIIDIDRRNANASIVGDICDPALAESREGRFGTIICTAVLQLVEDPATAVANMHTMLRVGGSLVLAEKALSPIDPWDSAIDRWRFTQYGLALLMRPFWRTEISTYGNLYALRAYMTGLPAERCDVGKLDSIDAQFPIVTVARGWK